jgi:hypothetical protein
MSDQALLQAQYARLMRDQHNDRAELAALRAGPVASGSMADWELVRMQVLVEEHRVP